MGLGAKDMATELHEAAYKVAKYYVEIFDYADKNVDDKISSGEISEIIQMHNWPKYPEKTADQMADKIIEEYGNKAKQDMDVG